MRNYDKITYVAVYRKHLHELKRLGIMPKKKRYPVYIVPPAVMDSLEDMRVTVQNYHVLREIKDRLLIVFPIGISVCLIPNTLSIKVVIMDCFKQVVNIYIKDDAGELTSPDYAMEVNGNGRNYDVKNILKIIGILTTENIKFPDPVEYSVTRNRLLAQGLHDEAAEHEPCMFINLEDIKNVSRRKKKEVPKKSFLRKGHFRQQKVTKGGVTTVKTVWIHHSIVHPEDCVPKKIFIKEG